eukprot:jgi/Mesvir1/1949/Mv22967-RA.1
MVRRCYYDKCPTQLPAKSKCGGCQAIAYCGLQCYHADWPTHKSACTSPSGPNGAKIPDVSRAMMSNPTRKEVEKTLHRMQDYIDRFPLKDTVSIPATLTAAKKLLPPADFADHVLFLMSSSLLRTMASTAEYLIFTWQGHVDIWYGDHGSIFHALVCQLVGAIATSRKSGDGSKAPVKEADDEYVGEIRCIISLVFKYAVEKPRDAHQGTSARDLLLRYFKAVGTMSFHAYTVGGKPLSDVTGSPLLPVLMYGDLETLKFLMAPLEAARIGFSDCRIFAPLLVAVKHGRSADMVQEVARLVFQEMANPGLHVGSYAWDEVWSDGDTLIHVLARNNGSWKLLKEVLEKAGHVINLNSVSKAGDRPLAILLRKGKAAAPTVLHMLDVGASIDTATGPHPVSLLGLALEARGPLPPAATEVSADSKATETLAAVTGEAVGSRAEASGHTVASADATVAKKKKKKKQAAAAGMQEVIDKLMASGTLNVKAELIYGLQHQPSLVTFLLSRLSHVVAPPGSVMDMSSITGPVTDLLQSSKASQPITLDMAPKWAEVLPAMCKQPIIDQVRLALPPTYTKAVDEAQSLLYDSVFQGDLEQVDRMLACMRQAQPPVVVFLTKDVNSMVLLLSLAAFVSGSSLERLPEGPLPLSNLVASGASRATISLLLDLGASPDAPSNTEMAPSPLHMAARTNNWDVAGILIMRGAKVNVVVQPSRDTPLHWASQRKNVDTILLLMVFGADPCVLNKDGIPALCLSGLISQGIDTQVLKELLNYERVDVNQDVKGSQPPLQAALSRGDLTIAELLLQRGADPNAVAQGRGETALHVAARSNNVAAVKLLLAHGANVLALCKGGKGSLEAVSGLKEIGKLLTAARAQALEEADKQTRIKKAQKKKERAACKKASEASEGTGGACEPGGTANAAKGGKKRGHVGDAASESAQQALAGIEAAKELPPQEKRLNRIREALEQLQQVRAALAAAAATTTTTTADASSSSSSSSGGRPGAMERTTLNCDGELNPSPKGGQEVEGRADGPMAACSHAGEAAPGAPSIGPVTSAVATTAVSAGGQPDGQLDPEPLASAGGGSSGDKGVHGTQDCLAAAAKLSSREVVDASSSDDDGEGSDSDDEGSDEDGGEVSKSGSRQEAGKVASTQPPHGKAGSRQQGLLAAKGNLPLPPWQLEGMPWELEITKVARGQWERLDLALKRAVSAKLVKLAGGRWVAGTSRRLAKRIKGVKGLMLFNARFAKRHGGGRILWEKAVSFSQRVSTYVEIIRVWAIIARHDELAPAIQLIAEAHRRGRQSLLKHRLKLMGLTNKGGSAALTTPSAASSESTSAHGPMTLPRVFCSLGEVRSSGRGGPTAVTTASQPGPQPGQRPGDSEAPALSNTHREGGEDIQDGDGDGGTVADLVVEGDGTFLLYPIAVASQDAYTILKFYTISAGLLGSMLHAAVAQQGVGGVGSDGGGIAEVEFPFRVAEQEHAIITAVPHPPSSMLLLGRSGTGKTTCTVFRMWGLYAAYWEHATAPLLAGPGGAECGSHLHQVFVTANPVLRQEVAKFFRALRRGHRLGRWGKPAEEGADMGGGPADAGLLGASPPAATDAGTQVTTQNAGVQASGNGGANEVHGQAESDHEDKAARGGKAGHETGMAQAGRDSMEEEEEEAANWHSLCAVEERDFPLFVTKREWLVLLDGTLRNPFFARQSGSVDEQDNDRENDREGRLTAEAVALAFGHDDLQGLFEVPEYGEEDAFEQEEEGALEGQGMEGREDGGGALGDGMMGTGGEGLGEGGGRRKQAAAKRKTSDGNKSTALPKVQRGATGATVEVDYNYFVEALWPQMCPSGSQSRGSAGSGGSKGGGVAAREGAGASIIDGETGVMLHPALVWTEIASFIKGSVGALESPQGYLSFEQYEALGAKKSPSFVGSRHALYSLFLKYEQLRKQCRGFDLGDLVRYIYRAVSAGEQQVFAPAVHSIFIDEVQDFTEAELQLCVRVCVDPNGLFLTGDTAQTIARGVAFRFADLRSIFHHESTRNPRCNPPREVIKLVNNYRTHAGILQLANVVVELLEAFFPASIDSLPPDRGLFEGPKPWVLSSCSFEDLCVLLLGSNRDAQIDFGAQQAVIVRDQESKKQLPDEILRGGLVCTVFESKGLEFEDVLLYNFFKDSPASKEWRAVLWYLQQQQQRAAERGDRRDEQGGIPPSAQCQSSSTSSSSSAAAAAAAAAAAEDQEGGTQMPAASSSALRPLAFDANAHKILLSELKHLYTAVTRARVNLWIYDESLDKRAPMFQLFCARGLVRVVSSVLAEERLALTKGSVTTAEEWRMQGANLYTKKAYGLAAQCFAKAGDEALMRRARGWHNVEEAMGRAALLSAEQQGRVPLEDRGHGGGDKISSPEECFLEAGEDFLFCGGEGGLGVEELLRAAKCFEKAGHAEFAGAILVALGRPVAAARLYLNAGMAREAARLYQEKGLVPRAADALLKGGHVPDAVTMLEANNLIKEATKAALVHGRGATSELLGGLLLRHAAVCPDVVTATSRWHSQARRWREGAELMVKAGMLGEAVALLKEGGVSDVGLALVNSHRAELASITPGGTRAVAELRDTFARLEAQRCKAAGDRGAMMAALTQLSSKKEQVKLLQALQCGHELADLYVRQGDRVAAASIWMAHGELAKALEVLGKGGKGKEERAARVRALCYRAMAFGNKPPPLASKVKISTGAVVAATQGVGDARSVWEEGEPRKEERQNTIQKDIPNGGGAQECDREGHGQQPVTRPAGAQVQATEASGPTHDLPISENVTTETASREPPWEDPALELWRNALACARQGGDALGVAEATWGVAARARDEAMAREAAAAFSDAGCPVGELFCRLLLVQLLLANTTRVADASSSTTPSKAQAGTPAVCVAKTERKEDVRAEDVVVGGAGPGQVGHPAPGQVQGGGEGEGTPALTSANISCLPRPLPDHETRAELAVEEMARVVTLAVALVAALQGTGFNPGSIPWANGAKGGPMGRDALLASTYTFFGCQKLPDGLTLGYHRACYRLVAAMARESGGAEGMLPTLQQAMTAGGGESSNASPFVTTMVCRAERCHAILTRHLLSEVVCVAHAVAPAFSRAMKKGLTLHSAGGDSAAPSPPLELASSQVLEHLPEVGGCSAVIEAVEGHLITHLRRSLALLIISDGCSRLLGCAGEGERLWALKRAEWRLSVAANPDTRHATTLAGVAGVLRSRLPGMLASIVALRPATKRLAVEPPGLSGSGAALFAAAQLHYFRDPAVQGALRSALVLGTHKPFPARSEGELADITSPGSQLRRVGALLALRPVAVVCQQNLLFRQLMGEVGLHLGRLVGQLCEQGKVDEGAAEGGDGAGGGQGAAEARDGVPGAGGPNAHERAADTKPSPVVGKEVSMLDANQWSAAYVRENVVELVRAFMGSIPNSNALHWTNPLLLVRSQVMIAKAAVDSWQRVNAAANNSPGWLPAAGVDQAKGPRVASAMASQANTQASKPSPAESLLRGEGTAEGDTVVNPDGTAEVKAASDPVTPVFPEPDALTSSNQQPQDRGVKGPPAHTITRAPASAGQDQGSSSGPPSFSSSLSAAATAAASSSALPTFSSILTSAPLSVQKDAESLLVVPPPLSSSARTTFSALLKDKPAQASPETQEKGGSYITAAAAAAAPANKATASHLPPQPASNVITDKQHKPRDMAASDKSSGAKRGDHPLVPYDQQEGSTHLPLVMPGSLASYLLDLLEEAMVAVLLTLGTSHDAPFCLPASYVRCFLSTTRVRYGAMQGLEGRLVAAFAADPHLRQQTKKLSVDMLHRLLDVLGGEALTSIVAQASGAPLMAATAASGAGVAPTAAAGKALAGVGSDPRNDSSSRAAGPAHSMALGPLLQQRLAVLRVAAVCNAPALGSWGRGPCWQKLLASCTADARQLLPEAFPPLSDPPSAAVGVAGWPVSGGGNMPKPPASSAGAPDDVSGVVALLQQGPYGQWKDPIMKLRVASESIAAAIATPAAHAKAGAKPSMRPSSLPSPQMVSSLMMGSALPSKATLGFPGAGDSSDGGGAQPLAG